MARAGAAGIHGDRVGALGRAYRAGVSGVRPALADASGARRAGPGVPVAGALRGAALRLRVGDAGGDLDAVTGVRGPVAHVVAHGAGDPVLAPDRARVAADPGDHGAQPV